MRSSPLFLFNGSALDLAPSCTLRARTVELQRRLATNDWVLRRKSDGRFLALGAPGDCGIRWLWLTRSATRSTRLEADSLARQARLPKRSGCVRARLQHPRTADAFVVPVDAHYAERTGLAPVLEPSILGFGGFDRYRRALWLAPAAARAWNRMRSAASCDGVVLEAISGFRSRAYQVGIFRRKQARGQSLEEILGVNAAPGFSEHHSGCALDIGTPGEPPAEESFEHTPAFSWLSERAANFGFQMSYPRGNRHGISYEPWHWMWHRAT